MQKEEAYFLHLLSGYIDNTLSKDQVKELFDFIAENKVGTSSLLNNPQIKEKLGAMAALGRHEIPDLLSKRMRDRLLSAIEISDIQTRPVSNPATIRMPWLRYAAAAVAILLISTATYVYFSNKNVKPVAVAQIPTDVKAPQTNRATVTLANGQKVFLDSASNGELALQNNIKLMKTAAGKITYDGSQPVAENAALVYNTLENPRGSKVIDLVLSDGTHVWLNAGSSLTYPVAFSGKERTVEITGEAYFEVFHNANMPFNVKKMHDDTKVQVLGTHFNVNAYDDESSVRVTLLEGSVKVTKGAKKSLLRPGQQAKINNLEIKVSSDVDMDQVMAWKNGKFQFGDASDIRTIMRQISRWYDVDVEYQGNVDGNIGGSISRDVNASQVLKMLETTGVIKYKIQGKKVTIMPASP